MKQKKSDKMKKLMAELAKAQPKSKAPKAKAKAKAKASKEGVLAKIAKVITRKQK